METVPTVAGLDVVLNMHRDPGIRRSEHPSTSDHPFVTFEEIRQEMRQEHHVPAHKRSRGRPRIDYSKIENDRTRNSY